MTQRHVPYSVRRAYLVWAAATAAYIVAVVQRTSLGVSGLEALERFGASAAVLSLFTVTQLVVYSAAQIPVGMALDRFGPRNLIGVGALMMAVGQFGMAFAPSVELAIVARVLIGAGDATTFVSVLKIITAWFPPKRAPLLGQISGQIAQTGQILSAVPFVIVLHHLEWSAAFTILGFLGVLSALVVFTWVRDRPSDFATTIGAAGAKSGARAVDMVPSQPQFSPFMGALKASGSWLGFWSHMVTGFSFNVFVFLWGYPFLLLGQNLTQAQASLLFTWLTLTAMMAGPLIGMFCARHPLRRSWLVLAVTAGVILAWLLVLLPTTPRPMWVLFIFVSLLGVGGPASLIGLDYARTSNPAERFGVASGLSNMGSFVGGFICILAIGVVLDRVRPDGAYTLADFRVAFSIMIVPMLVSLIFVIITRRGTRAEFAERGIRIQPVTQVWRDRHKP